MYIMYTQTLSLKSRVDVIILTTQELVGLVYKGADLLQRFPFPSALPKLCIDRKDNANIQMSYSEEVEEFSIKVHLNCSKY